MSTGFSGNLGFLLPENWAFDQISTLTVGTGDGALEIDNNISSGRDPGQSSVAPHPIGTLDTPWNSDYTDDLKSDVTFYLENTDLFIPPDVVLLNGGPADVTDTVLSHDRLITSLSRAWGIRKALIQAVAIWEHWRENTLDVVSDTAVRGWYAYCQAYEIWLNFPVGPAPLAPLPPFDLDDSSTGFAQILARTAIKSNNWAVAEGQQPGSILEMDDWHTMWRVWQDLNTDVSHNLSMVPVVLMWGANEVNVPGGPRLDYNTGEIREILSRYNGTNADAQAYGWRLLGLYDILEGYNDAIRSMI